MFEGEMWAYYEPELKYWLFTREDSYGHYGEMFDWVLCKPDGTYIIQATDEFGEKSRFTRKIEFLKNEKLPLSFSPAGNDTLFKFGDFLISELEAKKYKKVYPRSSEDTFIYIGDIDDINDIDLTPVYYFNELSKTTEIRLPVNFPPDMPGNKLMLGERTYAAWGIVKTNLKWITPTEYYIYPE